MLTIESRKREIETDMLRVRQSLLDAESALAKLESDSPDGCRG